MRVVAMAVALMLVLGGPASAGTPGDPELKDDCGVGTHVAQEQVPPWLDLCGGWFSSPAPGELKVTVEVADLLQSRSDSQYWVSWTAGGCSFTVQRMDGGAELAPGDAVSRLVAQCVPAREVECPPPFKQLGYTCWQSDKEPVIIDVSHGYEEAGNRLSWTLRFEDDLARYAPHHADGAVLTSRGAMTSVGVNSAPFTGPGYCTRESGAGWECQNQVTDWIPGGRDYVVGS